MFYFLIHIHQNELLNDLFTRTDFIKVRSILSWSLQAFPLVRNERWNVININNICHQQRKPIWGVKVIRFFKRCWTMNQKEPFNSHHSYTTDQTFLHGFSSRTTWTVKSVTFFLGSWIVVSLILSYQVGQQHLTKIYKQAKLPQSHTTAGNARVEYCP